MLYFQHGRSVQWKKKPIYGLSSLGHNFRVYSWKTVKVIFKQSWYFLKTATSVAFQWKPVFKNQKFSQKLGQNITKCWLAGKWDLPNQLRHWFIYMGSSPPAVARKSTSSKGNAPIWEAISYLCWLFLACHLSKRNTHISYTTSSDGSLFPETKGWMLYFPGKRIF